MTNGVTIQYIYRYKNNKEYIKPLVILPTEIKPKVKEPIIEVFFFSENCAHCRTHLDSNFPCSNRNCSILSLRRFVTYLLSSRRTLDICVYFLTCSLIVKQILKLKRRNIYIRVITNKEAQDVEPMQILILRRAGIQIRSRKSTYLMHHKFAVIDNEILITGSANWTLQAFFGNCENLIITNQCELVQAYSLEFEKLWFRFRMNKKAVL
ncbi:PREDICTED: mitochondrial cardiolipin hydrolase [Ceratosolen solmsi marchali]|uniref:Mitochondrial cardiolipin hydrolase n=1 Tax=Ceratosolen solmsi marchali TaxID=326594 RepID=A0AAJ6VLH5_9HYME|nr:PREDICTED: mitochondrial cardiolipin hydrolase [Ceratosolen solmsi marchali]